jgi:hypothetical protein
MHITKKQIIYTIIIIFVLYLLYKIHINKIHINKIHINKIYINKKEYMSEINITEQINTLVDLINTSTIEYIYQEQRYKYDYKVNIIIDKDLIVFRPESSQIQSHEEDDLPNTPKPGAIIIKYIEKEQKYYLIKYISFGRIKLVRKIDITSNVHNLINTLKDYQIVFLPSAIQVKGANIKLIVNEDKTINYLI